MAKPPYTNFCPVKYIFELPLEQISISNETVTILIILHSNPQLPTHGLHTKKTALSGQEAIFIGMAASLHLILLYPMIPI